MSATLKQKLKSPFRILLLVASVSIESRPKVKLQFLHLAILAFFCTLGMYNSRSLKLLPRSQPELLFHLSFWYWTRVLDKKIVMYNQRSLQLLSVLQFGNPSEIYQSNAISNETDDGSDCYVCTRELAGAPNYSVGYNCCLSDTPPPPSDTQMLRCSDHQK